MKDIIIEKEIVEPPKENIFHRRKKWGQGIQVYRLENGKFLNKAQDEDLIK